MSFFVKPVGETEPIHFNLELPVQFFSSEISIYVSGAVLSPGIFKLNEGSRISDAINLAGGFLEDADIEMINSQLNLVEILKDVQQIYIPFNIENPVSGSTAGRININTCSLEELLDLSGIGEATAKKIIENRPYSTIEGLLEVSGIGESKFGQIKSYIEV